MSTQTGISSNGSHPEVAPQIGSRDKSVGWYDKAFHGVTPDARELLEGYAHVPGPDVDSYVLEMVLPAHISIHPEAGTDTRTRETRHGISTPIHASANFVSST